MSLVNQGVFVLGATGPTGRLVTERLRSRGVAVSVLHRRPDEADDFRELGASVIAGDALDRQSLEAAMAEAAQSCAVVVNLLGGNPMVPPDQWPDYSGTVNAVDAALKSGFDAMLLVTSVGTGESRQWVPADSFLLPILDLKSRAEDYLAASDLPGIVIKPGGLGMPGSVEPGGDLLVTENSGVRGLLAREDLADVIVATLDESLESVQGRDLYVVAQRIEEFAGKAEPFSFSSGALSA